MLKNGVKYTNNINLDQTSLLSLALRIILMVYLCQSDLQSGSTTHYVSSVLEGTNARRSSLVIERTSMNHKGEYTCIATSDLGQKDAKVTLDVLGNVFCFDL